LPFYGFTSLTDNAWLGQLVTHAGVSIPWQRSHLATTLPCQSIFMAPYGQTMMQVQQPMHLPALCLTSPVAWSFCMAPERQAVTQGASLQLRHWIANEIGLLTSNLIRLIGFGCSLLYALIVFFDCECWTVQYTSHNPQPMQASCLAIIFFIILFLRYLAGSDKIGA
jgi:hypothetical protein